ncbi:MAG TPA: protein kinase [Candidatus Polarisedimenticolaceae bacterium]|nr:protein kinase [Candidatus Polarisedimenticolaceae bacterium]
MLTPGTRLGPYEVVAPLGAGGMGEVYRAKDPRLGREVAIKVLPESVARDPDRLARFEREARLLAALGHAGIAAIYGVEDAGGTPALVMELVEGPTLAERIAQGPLSPDDALPVARQLAEALEYAHEHGIVHRDLKPANVKLRPDGTVKVLDFGLARALELEASGATGNSAHSPTLTQGMTRDGIIVGTAAYMAPEQARGKPADRRADVWAFGVVVFEMLAGRLLFAGETTSDTLAAVMRDEPDWSALPPGLSPRWRALLRRCLTKDPRQRLQSIGEARIALEELASNPSETTSSSISAPPPTTPTSRTRQLLPWLVAAAALLALATLALWPKPSAPSIHTELGVVPYGGQKVGLDLSYIPIALSPDGKTLAYTVRQEGTLRLRLRRLDAREDVEIAGAEGARNLFFSPDSQWVGFFDTRKMSKVSVHGGTPIALADSLQDRLGTWLDDGTIVYAREVTEPLFRIPENGGTPVELTKLDPTKRERTHRWPCALDGGPWIVFTAQTVDSPGGYDDAAIDAVNVKTGERRHLFQGARRAAWAPGGTLILVRGSDLYAVPIDPRNPRLTQEPVPVLADVSGDASSGASYFSIARDGTLAWIPGGEPDKTREIGWYDRAGRWTPTQIPAGPYTKVSLAHDGRRCLVSVGPGGGNADLWLADLETGGMNRLTHGGRSGNGALSPDGVHLVYARSDGKGNEMVVVRRLDGQGGERELYRAPNPLMVTGVTANGKDVVFSDYGIRTARIHVAALDGSSPARALPVEGDGYEQAAVPSPDGKWLAHCSTKTRREEVCVRPLDGSGASWQLSSKGAGGARWGRDSGEVFFVMGETLYRNALGAHGDTLSPGQPQELFEVPPSPTEASYRDYDYDPRTDRFLFTRPPKGTSERREIALSLGWAGRLGRSGDRHP